MVVSIALLVAALIVAIWVVTTRDSRKRWLSELDLLGTWDLDTSESDAPKSSLRFKGEIESGEYSYQSGDGRSEGTWRIEGSSLVLTDEEHGDREYEVRIFEHGTIGIHGPDRDRQVFTKRAENIVPLRRRS